MKALRAVGVRGVWGTVLLPLSDGGSIGWGRLAAQVDTLVVDGVYAHVRPDAAGPVPLARAAAATPSLIGVKMGGGDEDWYTAMTESVGDLSIFVPGHLLATGIARGAVAWYRQMTVDPEEALDLEARIGEFFRRHIAPLQAAGLSNPALDKFLATVGGWAGIGVTLRWPASSAPESAVGPARADAHRLLPELFPA